MQQHLLFDNSRKHIASLALMMTEVSERSSSLKKFCTVRRQSATIAALIKCWPPLGAVRASRILLAHFWSSTSPTFVMLQRNRITPGNNEKILNNGLVKLSNLWPGEVANSFPKAQIVLFHLRILEQAAVLAGVPEQVIFQTLF